MCLAFINELPESVSTFYPAPWLTTVSCLDPEMENRGTDTLPPTPLENHIAIGFLCNIGPDPMDQTTFRWRANDGPLLVVIGPILVVSPFINKINVVKVELLVYVPADLCDIFLCFVTIITTGPRSAVDNVSGYRCVSDCRIQGSRVRSRPGPILSWRLVISTVILLPSADLFKKGCCQLQAKVCAQITG